METRKLDTYPTTVNVIVTFEEEEQIIDDVDVTVMFNMYPLNRELDCLEQIMGELLKRNSNSGKEDISKRDYSRLVKLSLAYRVPDNEFYTASHDTGPRWEFIKRVNSKYYFQPNQRDLIEELLMQKFDVAFKTARFAYDDDANFSFGRIAYGHFGG